MKKPLALAGAGLLALAVGFLADRWSAPEPSPTAATARTTAAAVAGSPGAPELVPSAPATAAPGPCGHAHAATPAPAAPVPLEPALQAARLAAAAGPDEAHVIEAAKAAADGLHAHLARDPRALAAALRRFRALTDRAELELLASVLGRLPDPEVERLALEVAARDSLPVRREAALDLLDALDTPAAREVALEILRLETHPRLRRAALYALPAPTGASRREARDVHDQLGQTVRADPDPEARRRAAIALAPWATGPSELEPVRQALLQDADPAVRAGAAYALELAKQKDPALIAALLQALGDPDQPRLVRENAWKALGALSPLEPAAQRAWLTYGELRDGAGG